MIHLVHPLEVFVVAAQNAALFDVEETQLLDLGPENFPESRHHVRLRGFLRVHILLQLAYILALRGVYVVLFLFPIFFLCFTVSSLFCQTEDTVYESSAGRAAENSHNESVCHSNSSNLCGERRAVSGDHTVRLLSS